MKHIRVPLIAILLVGLALAPAAGQDQPKDVEGREKRRVKLIESEK